MILFEKQCSTANGDSKVPTFHPGQNQILQKTNRIDVILHYGNTGCQVFKQGGTKLERFLHKNQHTQRKLFNFEDWTNGQPQ